MKTSWLGGLFASVSVLVPSSVAAAQPTRAASPSGEATRVSELVVTAQKREERLIDVPLSITAIPEEDLVRRGVSAIEDLQYAVPGISITQFAPAQQRIQMRGISAYSGLPTVAVYQDELPLNLEVNQSGQDVRLLDIARIEVLRGPQGTLYGQGAVGGAIRYITNDVDLTHFGAAATGEVAGVDGGGADWKAEGVVNLPFVADRIGARLAASYQHFGGWIDNPVLGDKNVNDGHALTLRGKLTAAVTDDFRVSLVVQHQDLDIGAQNLSDDDRQVFDRLPTSYRSKVTFVNAIATYDFGSATLLSSTGYLERRDRGVQDVTGSLGPLINLITGLPLAAIQSVGVEGEPRFDIFTQEVRLASKGNDRFQWTLGAFYRDAETSTTASATLAPALLPPGFPLLSSEGTNPADSRSWAVFGEVSYDILPNLNALVGLRYFEDRRRQDSISTVFGATSVDIGRGDFHALSPRFNLSWRPSARVNLYANVAKGFRSGGFNSAAAGAGLVAVPPTYDPDTLWSYEVGGKFQSADRKVSLELAGYRNAWTGVQTTTNVAGLPISFTSNGGKISGWGADGSLNYSPTDMLTLGLTASWNDMEYKSNSAEHLAGDRADYVPRFTGSAFAEYRFTLGDLPSFARVDYQYSSRFQVFLRNFQVAPGFSDEQDILNARIGVSGGSWTAAAFVRNLLNRDSVIYPAIATLPYPARLEPRAAGVMFSVKY